MKKLAFIAVFVLAFALMGGLALGAAGETPHGPFNDDTAVCAACHRAHTASAEYLLAAPKVTALCITCHTDGKGADTDVVNGQYVSAGTNYGLAAPAGYDHDDWGNPGASNTGALSNVLTDTPLTAAEPLLGGGFKKVGGTANGVVTTSKHMSVDAATLNETAWDIKFGHGNDPGETIYFLDCVDCHGPHRSTNYRMLRAVPTGATSATDYPVKDNFARDGENKITESHMYTEDVGMFNIKYGAGTSSISAWCGGCHDYYYRGAIRADNKSGNLLSGQTSGPTTKVTTNAAANAGAILVQRMDSMKEPVVSPPSPGSTIHIGGQTFHVADLSGTGTGAGTVTFASGETLAAAVFAGSMVTIEGAGMEVYFDLDNDAGATADQSYMHAVDVDLSYLPRNGSLASALDLSTPLETGTYAGTLPVYDQGTGVGSEGYDIADKLNCLTCHRAHGSEVAMNEESELTAIVRKTNNATAQLPFGEDSMLLRLPNRAVCNTCHDMPQGF